MFSSGLLRDKLAGYPAKLSNSGDEMNNSYKVSYAFAGIYLALLFVNLFLTHWSTAITDALLVALFLRIGTYEEAIAKGLLVRKVELFDYSK
jgi:hypothetical protein